MSTAQAKSPFATPDVGPIGISLVHHHKGETASQPTTVRLERRWHLQRATSMTPVHIDGRYSPWFGNVADSQPTCTGVYEGTACGIPGFHDAAYQHMFYFWDGGRFIGSGRTPSEAEVDAARGSDVSHPVMYWRGQSKVSTPPTAPPCGERSYAGRLDLVTEHQFGLRIERLIVVGEREGACARPRAKFRFTTDQMEQCAMEGECSRNALGWFISAQRLQRMRKPDIHGVVVFRLEEHDGRCFLYGVWKQEDEGDKLFSGEVQFLELPT